MPTGIILLGHGSRSSEANDGLIVVADKVTHILNRSVTPAFLTQGTPDLRSAITEKILNGTTRIVIMPMFLFCGIYVSTEIYQEIADIKAQFPQIEIIVAKELGADETIANLVYSRIRETIET